MSDHPPNTTAPALSSSRALGETAAPAIDAELLLQGLRSLQHRIPNFIQVSADERRVMLRASSLSPAFLERGMHTAGIWKHTKQLFGMTAEELRQMSEDIRMWDEIECELRVLTKGVSATNLKRKHAFGSLILKLYKVISHVLTDPGESYLRPYYEEMKRAYMRTRKRSPKDATEDEPETPQES